MIRCFIYRLSNCIYYIFLSWVQKLLVQATYWHDPLNEALYKNDSTFLSDINNERTINQTYIDNIQKLENFIMVKFENDSMVQPVESEWFGFYKPGQSVEVESLQESALYKEVKTCNIFRSLVNFFGNLQKSSSSTANLPTYLRIIYHGTLTRIVGVDLPIYRKFDDRVSFDRDMNWNCLANLSLNQLCRKS